MSHLSLTLLGPLQIEVDGEPANGFESDKVRALLAYLAVEAKRPHRREALAELFWPDRPQGVGRDSLRQALANLRKAINDRQSEPAFLHITRNEVHFNTASRHQVDVTTFTTLLEACAEHPHRRMTTCRPCIQRLEQAVALYQGDFLAQFFLRDSPVFEEWVLLKREALQRQMLTALKHVADYHTRWAAYAEAIPLVRRQVALEAWDETAQRRLMHLLALDGQRNAALAQYQTLARILAAELGVKPTAETTALYERLKAEDGELKIEDDKSREVINASSTFHSLSPSHQHNLPPQPTLFIGREADLLEIMEELEHPACRLLTLVGPGGIGKTRLALQVAAENIGGYNDGLYFVPLVGLSSADYLVNAIAEAIHFTFSGEQAPERQLLRYLREKEMLLLLDNFEHLLTSTQGVELLAQIIKSSPGMKLLVTSRERLKLQSEWLYTVEGMAYPAEANGEWGASSGIETYSAVRLFIACARRVQPDFALTADNRSEVLRICRAVDGVPLGLELAAAWVRSLSLADIADELEGGLDLLTTTLHDIPSRHRSLKAVFDHSWQLLSEAEQMVFKRMAVFQGSFDREAAKQVAGAFLPDLSALVDKSLLKHTTAGRYEIHELLRQFSQEKLEQDATIKARTQDRHCRYYGDFLTARETDLTGQGQKEALQKIERDIDNIRAGWGWAVSHKKDEALEKYLDSLVQFYRVRSWYQEAMEALNRAIDAFSNNRIETVNNLLLGRLLAHQGTMYHHLYRFDQARDALTRSLALLRGVGEQSQKHIAYTLFYLGSLSIFQGVPAEAQPLFEESLTTYKALGDKYGVMQALCKVGWVMLKQGKLETARSYLQESLVMHQTLVGDHSSTVWVLMDLGELAHGQGQYDQARHYLQESLRICQQLDYTNGLAFALADLGQVVCDEGAYQEAMDRYQTCLVAYQAWGDHRGQGWSLAMLGYLALLRGERTQAQTYLEKSHACCLENGAELWWCQCIRGELALAQGQYEQATAHFRESLALFEDVGDIGVSWGEAWALKGLGRSAVATAGYATAQAYFQQGMKLALAVAYLPEALDIVLEMAILLIKQSQPERAIELLAHLSHNPATRQRTRTQATHLLAEVAATLPPDVFATAQASGQSQTLDKLRLSLGVDE